MAFPRNETGPAGCDFRRGPVGGAARASRRPGEHSAEPGGPRSPPCHPGGMRPAASPRRLSCPARSSDSPPALTPPGWGSAAWNSDPLGIDSSQLNSAFSSTFQTVECKHQVFPLVGYCECVTVTHSLPPSHQHPPHAHQSPRGPSPWEWGSPVHPGPWPPTPVLRWLLNRLSVSWPVPSPLSSPLLTGSGWVTRPQQG